MCARVMIYGFLVLFFVSIGLFGYVVFEHYQDLKAKKDEDSDFYLGVAITIWSIGALLL